MAIGDTKKQVIKARIIRNCSVRGEPVKEGQVEDLYEDDFIILKNLKKAVEYGSEGDYFTKREKEAENAKTVASSRSAKPAEKSESGKSAASAGSAA